MISPALMVKLALLPAKRSSLLLTLLIVSMAQLMLAFWFLSSIQKEVEHSRQYADRAQVLTIQLKDQGSPEAILSLFSDSKISTEMLSSEEVLDWMAEEEPEIVHAARTIGNEGLQLAPKMIIARGLIDSALIDRVKVLTEVSRVDVSPVHHAKLKSFYQQFRTELALAGFIVIFLIAVQLLVLRKIQERDHFEIKSNLLAWGYPKTFSRVPSFISLTAICVISFVVSGVEWVVFQKVFWKNNTFLGELSIDHHLEFPLGLVFLTLVGIILFSVVLSFSGRDPAE